MQKVTPSPCPVYVTLMGQFSITRNDQPALLRGGQVDLIVMFLAARGGAAHVEMLAELLWPGAPAASALTRLRNVLSRARRAHPQLLIRRHHLVTFTAGVSIDAVEFQQRAQEALLADDPSDAQASARQALRLYREPIVPDYPYADWAIELTRHLQALHRRVAVLADTATFPHHKSSGPIP